MKRLYLSAVIFFVIICLCIFSVIFIKTSCEKMISLAENLQQSYILRGNSPETQKNLMELENYTEKYRKHLSAFTKSEPLTEIYCEVSRLGNLLDKESDEFLSEIKQIESRVILVSPGGR